MGTKEGLRWAGWHHGGFSTGAAHGLCMGAPCAFGAADFHPLGLESDFF